MAMNNDSDIEVEIKQVMWNDELYYLVESYEMLYTKDVIENYYAEPDESNEEVDNSTMQDPKWSKLYKEFKKEQLYKYLIMKWKVQCFKKIINKISEWFLQCKYNPSYKYCRKRVDALYDEEY